MYHNSSCPIALHPQQQLALEQMQCQPELSMAMGIPNTLGAGQYRDPRAADIEDKARLVVKMWDAFMTQDEPWDLTPAIDFLRAALEREQ